MEVFKNLVLRDLEQIVPKKDVNQRHIREGIESLEKRKDIIVRPADKGGGVILDKGFYHQQMTEMLSDECTDNKLRKYPSLAYKDQLKRYVEYKIVCRIPVIYTLPKVHKDANCPPARLIVNGI